MREAALMIAGQCNSTNPSSVDRLATAILRPFQTIGQAWRLARLRARLDALDDHQLDDIGLTRADIDDLGGTEFSATPEAAFSQLVAARRRDRWGRSARRC